MNSLQFRRLGMRLSKILKSKFGRRAKTYFHDRVREYREIWTHAARECGADFSEIAEDLWLAERDGVGVRLRNHEVQLDDWVTLQIAGRKPLMHRLLAEAGLSVPDHLVVTLADLRPAFAFLGSHRAGVVVKPANGSAAGDGVSTHLKADAEVRKAAILASLYDSEILVEAMVPGESYRALVVGGKMLHAVCRRGPRVKGDGSSAVRELIAEHNRALAVDERLEVDRDCEFTLEWQTLGLDDVPPAGREVLLKAVENPEGGGNEIRTVYNAVVTDFICPSIRADVETAAAVLGSDFVGVDLIITDPTRPLSETGGCVNEVNTTPALHHHYDATKETFPPVAVEVLELSLLRRSQRGRASARSA